MRGAASRIFDLSLGQMLWSRRSVFLALAAIGPIALALLLRLLVASPLVRGLNAQGPALTGAMVFGAMIWFLYVRFLVPVLGVLYGTSFIADEVEDKTITYLFSRPIRRRAIVLGKYGAYLVCTSLVMLPSVVIVYFLTTPVGGGSIGAEFPALVKDLAMVALGLTTYGALFALIGARFKRPLVAGLLFVFGWEPTLLAFPGYLKRLTVAYYLQALVPHPVPADPTAGPLGQFFAEIPTAGTGLLWLSLITAAALWGAAWMVENREYLV